MKLRAKLLIKLNILLLKNQNLTAQNFKEKIKQANLVSKTDFDNKLISLNSKFTSNKTKDLEVKKN